MSEFSPTSSKYLTYNGKEVFTVDGIIGAFRIMQDNHQLVHRGKLFSSLISAANLDAGEQKIVSFKTPSDKFVHFKDIYLNAFGATVRLRLLKDSTVTDEGTNPYTINNLNDNSTLSAGSEIKDNPSYSGGTVWLETIVGGNTTNQSATGGMLSQVAGAEMVTKPNTVYIFELENIDTSNTAVYVSVFLLWAELNEGIIDDESV